MAKESKYEITITVDSNDADYNTKVSVIEESYLEIIKPLIKAIKEFKPYKGKHISSGSEWTHSHNYPFGEYAPREDLGEKPATEIYPQFDEETHEMLYTLCPYGEHGWHTIESIEITPFVKKTKLL